MLKLRYAVGYSGPEDVRGQCLTSISGVRIMEPGWYRIRFDDEGREAFEGGPYASAEEALRGGSS